MWGGTPASAAPPAPKAAAAAQSSSRQQAAHPEDAVADDGAVALAVLYRVAAVDVGRQEDVHDGEDLAVVGHERAPDDGAAGREAVAEQQLLERVHDGEDDLGDARVERLAHGQDELRHDGQHVRGRVREQVVDALHGEQLVRVLQLGSRREGEGGRRVR